LYSVAHMKKSGRPRSAGSHTKLQHAADGGEAKGTTSGAGMPSAGSSSVYREKSREGVPSASSRTRPRPRSAQPRPAYTAPGAQNGHLRALQEQCLELKRTANHLTEDNTKSRTRLMVLERELHRRERLLRQIVLMKKVGQGIDMDVLEKLREERNMLHVFRQKAQDLQGQVEKKEVEIRKLKRDPQFTRIIELQVEYATWQHESKRLESLLQEPSPEANDAAKQEVEVYAKRAEKLGSALTAAQERRDKVAADLAEMEADHEDWLQQYKDNERELQRQQDITRDLALSFKQVLQDRKQVEQLKDEIEEMDLQKRRYEEELRPPDGDSVSRASQELLPLNAVSGMSLQGGGPDSSAAAAPILCAVRRAAAATAGEGALLQHLRSHDRDADGLLSLPQLTAALGAIGYRDPSAELATICGEFAEWADGEQRIRWLDLLLILDRLGSLQGVLPAAALPLPNTRRLRAACLRAALTAEELHRRLEGVSSPAEAQALFLEIGLGAGAAEWCAAWQTLGTDGLLLRLPLSDVAMTKASHAGWLARCALAVRLYHKDLLESFSGVWPSQEMQLTEEQFKMVCNDVIGLELSEDDVDDLALFARTGDSGVVDCNAVLRLGDQ